jgi:cell division septation protein DedD
MNTFFKWLFLLLLFANVLLYAYGRFGMPAIGEPLKAHTALNADKLKLLSPQESAQAPAEKAKASICLDWGAFDDAGLARARKELDSLGVPPEHVGVRPLEEGTGRFWVYIPPLRSRADADKKLGEIRALDVEDGYIMQNDARMKFAISLGVFSTADAARKYLATLREKGVRSAVVGERKHATGESLLHITQGSDDLLEQLVRAKQRFPATTVKAVACES